MDVRKLIGKKFRYQSKHGLSDWTDTVKDIVTLNDIVFDPPLTMNTLTGDEITFVFIFDFLNPEDDDVNVGDLVEFGKLNDVGFICDIIF